MRSKWILAGILYAVSCYLAIGHGFPWPIASAQTVASATAAPAAGNIAPLPGNVAPAAAIAAIPAAIALSPAVIAVRCKPGQSTTQTLTIANRTPAEASFRVETQDVVVSEGKRWFVPAGRIANGIAANSVASPASIVVKPGEETSVLVTFTLPAETAQRAVVTFFRGVVADPAGGTVRLGASMGALITFNLSSGYNLEAGPMQASPQTPAANLILSEELHNNGPEPVVPKGVVVVLNASGKRVAKAAFNLQRLLPGERLMFAATNPAQLAPGHYRALSSFEFERKVLTSAGEFTIPE